MPVMILQTWQFIVLALAGWLNQQQQDIVAYLSEENRVLREQLKGKRLRFPIAGLYAQQAPIRRLWHRDKRLYIIADHSSRPESAP